MADDGFDAEHAADLRLVLRRPGVQVAQEAGRARGDGGAQPRQGGEAVRAPSTARGFYRNPVAPACRSWMNVPFTLAKPELDKPFLAEAGKAGLANLEGSPLRRRHARQHLQRDAGRRRRRAGRVHARTSQAPQRLRSRQGHMGFRDPHPQQHQRARAWSACRATATRSPPRSAHPDARPGALGRHARDGSCPSRCWRSARAGAGTNNIPVAALEPSAASRCSTRPAPTPTRSRSWCSPACSSRRATSARPGLSPRSLSGRRRTPSTRRSRRARRTSSASSCPAARSASSASAPSASRWRTRALALGMKVLGYDPQITVQRAWQLSSQRASRRCRSTTCSRAPTSSPCTCR